MNVLINAQLKAFYYGFMMATFCFYSNDDSQTLVESLTQSTR